MRPIPDVKATLQRLRERHWIDHVLRAWERYQQQRGDHYAAGITYFTVLSLFPLLMVGFAVAGFVLAGNESLLTDAQNKITENAPGDMGQQLNDIIDQAINSRASVGAIGLLIALYSGLGWMNNLRAALTAQWDQEHEKGKFVMTKVRDLGALAGLGIALVISFAVSALGSGAVLRQLLDWLNLDDVTGVGVVLRVAGILVGIAASWAVMVWVIARMPREPVTLASAVRAALIAAVAFEVFKQVGVVYLDKVLHSPAGVAFGPIIGIMVFAYFTARIVLFSTAWAATAPENLALVPVPPPAGAVIAPRLAVRGGPSFAEGAALVGAGALAVLGLSELRRRK
ncbi:inner membrane protein YhjD [Aldersonia sp. NBC_00410]|uniref:inner membrane protein YhjD n=1 Tax=Aldersonia sp. NBC_00410 TaxID=2975954 RepID=UPI0022534A36|nr:inner membrane protein YhjD [Aldersonia sp. NBC_00410]MCX5044456.1 inner membrane protein YhjD [Aldersonia sp. NBC_00410]